MTSFLVKLYDVRWTMNPRVGNAKKARLVSFYTSATYLSSVSTPSDSRDELHRHVSMK